MAKIAVVGSGISGLVCSYLLNQKHDVTLIEKNDYLGGHTHTHHLNIEDQNFTVDTGFIVYNDRSYPNFMKLLARLGITGNPSQMSFSVRDDNINLEYNGHTINSLFAQRLNIIRPSFHRMVRDILKFNKEAKLIDANEKATLGEFLDKNQYSKEFQNNYILPMAAAIWSTGDSNVKDFPVRSLSDFFLNHGLLDLKNRPQWYVVNGGSNAYIKPMVEQLEKIRLNTPVTGITRQKDHVEIQFQDESGPQIENFDQVILACHSDQALSLLTDVTTTEKEVLEGITYTPNRAYLHTDANLLPKRPLAWASWNYNLSSDTSHQATLTYNMNILQHIKTKTPILVTLNSDKIDPTKIIETFDYSHPFYNHKALASQHRHHEISGVDRTHYCGAYWSYGFHEDGVKSALRVCETFGVGL